MAKALFGRVITAMITPFHEDGSVDYEGAVTLAKHLLAHGSEGLLLGATTGEGATMTEEEKLKLYRTVVDAVGDKATILGNAGGADTAASCAFIKKVEATGVKGALAIVPFYVKPTQEGIYQHFKAIAAATKLPIMLYTVPGRTSSNILPETTKRLAEDCPNIVAIKEASGNFSQITEESRILPKDFMIYSGDDSFTLPILATGGVGVVSVSSHVIGEDMLAMVKAYEAGDVEKAKELHQKTFPMNKGLFFITSPIPVKTAINLLGLPGGAFRLPMVPANAAEKAHVEQLLKDYGLL